LTGSFIVVCSIRRSGANDWQWLLAGFGAQAQFSWLIFVVTKSNQKGLATSFALAAKREPKHWRRNSRSHLLKNCSLYFYFAAEIVHFRNKIKLIERGSGMVIFGLGV
jgi:hypothetical protein